jgi:predicted metal-dependent hydrolase
MDRRTATALIDRLRTDADRICARFGLHYAAIEAERANVKRRYGICYSDGTIKIRLRHATTGEALKYSSLVSTLCHELAHLRHFDHSPRFHDFYQQLLAWSRREGIYRPRSQGASPPPASPAEPTRGVVVRTGPEQLTLF